MTKLEYIWIDGTEPTAQLRSKTKVVENFSGNVIDCPDWGFDGSSTNQATGDNSDCILKPVRLYTDPFDDKNSTTYDSAESPFFINFLTDSPMNMSPSFELCPCKSINNPYL